MTQKKFIIPLLALALTTNVANAQGRENAFRSGFPGQEKIEEVRANYELRRAEVEKGQSEVKAQMEARRQEIKADIAGRMSSSTERRAFLAEKRAQLMQSHMQILVNNAVKMLTVTSERFDKIIERVESRIDKVKTGGGNTTEAEGFVAKAKTDLSEVKAAILNIPDLEISSSTDTSKPRNFEALRAAVKAVKAEMKSVHENLKSALTSLRSVENPEEDKDEDDSATTTNSSN